MKMLVFAMIVFLTILKLKYNSSAHGGGTFGTGVLTWLFGVCEIISGLKFRGPKCAICGLKFWQSEIIWGLIFLECRCPSHFLVSSFFRNWAADYLGSWKKLV